MGVKAVLDPRVREVVAGGRSVRVDLKMQARRIKITKNL
jgi:hypothetical protein